MDCKRVDGWQACDDGEDAAKIMNACTEGQSSEKNNCCGDRAKAHDQGRTMDSRDQCES